MSSIEPNDSGGEVDGGEEIARSFVVAGGDGPELFEFAEEVFDQMALLPDGAPYRGRGQSRQVQVGLVAAG